MDDGARRRRPARPRDPAVRRLRAPGLRIIAAFDSDSETVGQTYENLVVQPVSALRDSIDGQHVDIGIVATPAPSAQIVIDALVACGVKAILNYAPIAAHVPRDVHIKDIDPVLALQSMTFYLKNGAPDHRD